MVDLSLSPTFVPIRRYRQVLILWPTDSAADKPHFVIKAQVLTLKDGATTIIVYRDIKDEPLDLENKARNLLDTMVRQWFGIKEVIGDRY